MYNYQCIYLIQSLLIITVLLKRRMMMDQTNKTKLKQERQEKSEYPTNEVLMEKQNNIYYLPCYVRFKVKSIERIDIQGLQGSINGTLHFSFYYGNLDRQNIIGQFVGKTRKSIIIQYGQQSLELKENKRIVFTEDKNQKIITFVVRKDFSCNLEGDVFCTPFEIINLYFTITIHSVVLEPKEEKKPKPKPKGLEEKVGNIIIKFNCMTSQDSLLLGYSEDCKLGNYDLAQYYLDCKYKNSQKNPFTPISVICQNQEPAKARSPQKMPGEKQLKRTPSQAYICPDEQKGDDEKVKHFQYVHFRIPLYKYPGANLVNIFLPLWVLGFINLLIFFQDIALSGRIGAIATLTLAFIAFIPTINDQIPQTPYIKGVEILVYMETLASILCLIQSLSLSQTQDPATYVFQWRQDAFFIAALILNLLTVAIVLSGFIIHKCFWEKIYNQHRDDHHKQMKLQRKRWGNPQCDNEFEKHIRKQRISALK